MNYIELKLIETPKGLEAEQKETISQVNNFLLKNKGLIGDFETLKELVDRNADAAEEEINHLLPLPIYLGIGGSLLAIIIAFFTLSTLSDLSAEYLDTLFLVLKIAFLSSFTGLLLTLIAWGFPYRSARVFNKLQKKRFYDFINQEMDQQLSHNISSSIYALQSNLNSFNTSFTQNIGGFHQIINEVKNAFDQQVELMRDFKSLDLMELSEYNVKIMQEIRSSTREFEKFNSYLQQTNSMVDSIGELNKNLSQQFEKSDVLQQIVSSVNTNIELNKQMIAVLHSDLREIDTRKKFMADAVINVDHALQKSLEELKMHTQKKLDAIREITIKEENFMEKRFSNLDNHVNRDPKIEELLSSLQELIVEIKNKNA